MSVFLSRQVVPPLVSGVGSAIMAILLLSPVLLPRFFQDFVADDTSYPVFTNSLLDFLLPYFDLFNLYSGAVSVWSALLFLILTLVGIFYLFQLKPGLVFILLGWLLIPLLMIVVAQIFIDWFYAVHRHFIYILPVFIIIVAIGWTGLTKAFKNVNPVIGAVFAMVILIAILINSLLSISNYLQIATEGNWQDVSDFLVENAQPTDMFICEPVNHGWKAVDLDPTDNCTRNIRYRVSRQMNIIYPIYNLFAVATSQTFIENPVLLERNPRIWVVVWGLPESLDNQVESQASFDRFGHTIVLGPIAGDNVIDSVEQSLEQISALTDDPLTQFALLVRLADLQVAAGQTEPAVQTLAQVKKMMPADDEARHQVAAVEQRLNQPPILNMPEHNLSVNLGEQIVLQGYSVTPDPPLPGQPVELTLFWQALAPMDVDYSAFLHLRNEANQTVAQIDFFPNRPTSSWWVGDVLQSTRKFEIPAELPAGKYRLLVGLYNLETLERLPVQNDGTGEHAIELTKLEIQ
jgi:hypothetical protein